MASVGVERVGSPRGKRLGCGLGLLGLAVLVAAQATVGGCAGPREELISPGMSVAPYDTSRGDVVWAVVPLRNESGTSAVDALGMSDLVVSAAEQVRGVRCLPLNRTIETMRALQMPAVRTPGEAKTLAAAMGADGVIVGSVTAYDPYTPSLGLSLGLFARGGAMFVRGGDWEQNLNTKALSVRITEPEAGSRSMDGGGMVSSVSEVLDAKNHQVLMDVRSYALGRHQETDALGWRRYTASMPLYAEFASSHMVSRLVGKEWVRLGRDRAALAGAGDGRAEP
ncbi:MAG: hypothetical protein HRU70_13735 [Phycisphaeraceae bacterium]|nr:MAG: hypothetical protein HRU70_13735 [Phycisphaeraceae bacterium]